MLYIGIFIGFIIGLIFGAILIKKSGKQIAKPETKVVTNKVIKLINFEEQLEEVIRFKSKWDSGSKRLPSIYSTVGKEFALFGIGEDGCIVYTIQNNHWGGFPIIYNAKQAVREFGLEYKIEDPEFADMEGVLVSNEDYEELQKLKEIKIKAEEELESFVNG